MQKQTAKFITKALNRVLKVEANSTACGIIYQPKAPKTLERYRNNK